ncbi:hypothetical protein B4U80_07831 [Leptotrombidium deliense]|uniref:CCHC-type domain-containing protein n=1 Tax=Leptotrombidium deliense TaxID=299467 RepID=A0A443S606_9ACAR|nr:hypothetical protein B4U80_07831 [Leptotrombidium deliense]
MMNNDEKAAIREIFSDAIAANVSSSSIRVEQYNGHKRRDLMQFIDDFETLSDANRWSEETKIKKLQLYLRESARDWYDCYVKDTNKTWEEVLDSLKENFLPANTDRFLKEQIRSRSQYPGESVTNYILTKQKLCKRYDQNMLQADMLDYIFEGIEPEMARILLPTDPRTVNELLREARKFEYANEFANSRKKTVTINDNGDIDRKMDRLIDRLTEVLRPKYTSLPNQERYVNPNNTRRVDGNPKCYSCGRVGHVARNCQFQNQPSQYPRFASNNTSKAITRNPENRRVNSVDENSDALVNKTYVPQESQFEDDDIFTQVYVKNQKIKAMVDSGSVVTIMSKQLANFLDLKITSYKGNALKACNGSHLDVCGEAKAEISFETENNITNNVLLTVAIVDQFYYDLLLGRDFMKRSKAIIDFNHNTVNFFYKPLANKESDNESNIQSDIIPVCDLKYKDITDIRNRTSGIGSRNIDNNLNNKKLDSFKLGDPNLNNVEDVKVGEGYLKINKNLRPFEKRKLTMLLNKYSHLFAFNENKIGKCKGVEHVIETEGPPIHSAPYRYSPEQRKEIQSQIDKMLKMGIIRKSRSPYSSPVVLFPITENLYTGYQRYRESLRNSCEKTLNLSGAMNKRKRSIG